MKKDNEERHIDPRDKKKYFETGKGWDVSERTSDIDWNNQTKTQRPDENIRKEAYKVLHQHDQINASNIEVHVKNGRVFLRGAVDSIEMMRLAHRCIEHLNGVIEVDNELSLSL